MTEQLQEAFSLLQSDITFWNDAARQCEKTAAKLSEKERAEYMLLCAVYRERAEMLTDALQQLAVSNRQPSTGERASQDSGQEISG